MSISRQPRKHVVRAWEAFARRAQYHFLSIAALTLSTNAWSSSEASRFLNASSGQDEEEDKGRDVGRAVATAILLSVFLCCLCACSCICAYCCWRFCNHGVPGPYQERTLAKLYELEAKGYLPPISKFNEDEAKKVEQIRKEQATTQVGARSGSDIPAQPRV
mmetsp:Transcript_54367/g.99526  ORF Transcript_54367/g.99526 Transcript_54367/m.99526 type:complete len:162 (-) Transcript_54367:41-526(-)